MLSSGLFFIIPCMDTIQVVDLRYIKDNLTAFRKSLLKGVFDADDDHYVDVNIGILDRIC